ncbi:hypothetical protein [Shimia aestuarii]|uniref:Uncharacterized protein n=1 Tax=Shimia aestuarii TaxID=254406 RepID=A0A1I4P160_9RHOB|nr:hypothetical protein [Shimia aestuarii]SFM21574.1 hypothetical protein SAMN04488042_10537 [Shimia aestuarii]
MNHIDAKACARLWSAALAAQIKAARGGDRAAVHWLQTSGPPVAAMIGIDPDVIQDIAVDIIANH